MKPLLLLPFAAALLSLLLAVASVLRKQPSLATWCFFAGMLVLGADSLCTGLGLRATSLPGVLHWLSWGAVAKTCLPAAWLGFSLTYSRGDYREALAAWRLPLVVLGLAPVGVAVGARDRLMAFAAAPTGDVLLLISSPVARALSAVLLIAFVLVLMHLEQTFRSAVGTMRWRIKFVVLGLALIFGAQIYVQSQAILYSVHDMALAGVASAGLLVGGLFLGLAYARTGLAEIDVYPSRAVLRSSLTVVIVGTYLFIVGVLAQVVRRFGGAESFQFQALVVLVGMAGLAVLLLSDRMRQRIHEFVGRHFSKAQHDSVRIWTESSRQMASVHDRHSLCAATAKLVSESFDVLSVTVWLFEAQGEELLVAAATDRKAGSQESRSQEGSGQEGRIQATALRGRLSPFDLETLDEPWAEEMRRLNPTTFPQGGHRWCLPLRSGDDVLGAIVLADRVNGATYSVEELELLQCIADQMSSALANLRLGDEVARGRELEAFRSMSAFFVHDLKNATASLNLMLKNLPVHFDDPAFRADALRGIGNTVSRIDGLIGRLAAFRDQSGLRLAPLPLSTLVAEAIEELGPSPVEVTTDVPAELPMVMADGEQLRSVVVNLLHNARDAMAGQDGGIQVRAVLAAQRVVLTVADSGSGMTPAFVRNSLFKPFHSTKSKGLGIGMFQARRVIEAHGGQIQVESEEGVGTTVRLLLPAQDA